MPSNMKKELIQYGDFQKLDLRVGEIKAAAPLEGSRNLLQLSVDLGEEYGVVEILSGIADYYKPEDIVGNKYIFVANLEPKKMLGHYSNGMIMAVDVNGGETCILVQVPSSLKNGSIAR